ncbi:MAG: YceI family protein, partial [Cyanobacteria bacterium REEB65]|nr:YceI family protein [Cyanobacteria bacterium REEB65]
SRFEGEIGVASIDTHVAERDDHLRSADFFDADHYPTIHYRSKRIETLGGDRFRVIGDLTIRDKTREIALEGLYAGTPVRDPWGVLRTGFSARGSIRRKEFGVNWDMALGTGGLLVGDEVTIVLDIELKREEPA